MRVAAAVRVAGLRARYLRLAQQSVPGAQHHAAIVLEHGVIAAPVPRPHVSVRVSARRHARVRHVRKRFAVGATLVGHAGRSGHVLPGPCRRARVPARAAEHDEKMLRIRGHVQRAEDGVRAVRAAGPPRLGRGQRLAGRRVPRVPAVRRRARHVRPDQRVALARRRSVAGGRRATYRGRHDSPAARLLSGTRTRGTGTAGLDSVHLRAPRPRDQEQPRRHTFLALSTWTVGVRVLPGHHTGGQLHVAQHVSRAPLEVPSQSHRLPAGRRPVPRVRTTVRRLSTRTSLRVYR